jgi:tetratricopeptide (TPR) repeat protein
LIDRPDSHDFSSVRRLLSQRPVLISILLLVSISVYLNALSNSFVYDDRHLILNNQWIKDIKYIPRMFLETHEEFTNFYRPLTHLIFTIDYHIFGFNPWGFHLTNIIFHGGSCIFLFLVTVLIYKRGRVESSPAPDDLINPDRWAFIAALVFATHPINTESVAWVSGISELSCAFFFLLSLYFYLKADGTSGKCFVLSLVFFFVAVMSKETAVVLPLVFFACDYSFKKDSISSPAVLTKRYLPYLVLAAVYLALRTYAIGGFARESSHGYLSGYEYLINILPLFAQYLEKLLFPFNLSLVYGFDPILSIFEWRGLTSLLVVVSFIAAMYLLRDRNRVAFLCLLWIALPLLPVLYIPALGHSVFAERYLYMPSMGFAILVSTILSFAVTSGPFGRRVFGLTMYAVVFIVIFLYFSGTIKRNPVWKDDLSIWVDTAMKSPESHSVHHNLGLAYYDRGRIDEAIAEYKLALKLRPDEADVHNNLGLAYYDQGRTDEAMDQYRMALELKPDLAKALNNLGNAYLRKAQYDKAFEQYREALKIKPGLAGTHLNMGNVYYIAGRTDEAIDRYRTALRLAPKGV